MGRQEIGLQNKGNATRGVGGVFLQQDFAARPMQVGFECAMTQPIGSGQPFVEDRESVVEIARCSFSLSQRDLQ